MKKHSSLYYWFWYRPLFRRLRLRLMTMVVALVLPVCLAGIVISIVSANQGAKLNYAIGNNGLGMFANSVAQRCHYEDIDLLSDFPTTFAGEVSPLVDVAAADQGRVYVSTNGQEAWQVLSPEGETVPAGNFDALRENRESYYWENEEGTLRILVTFPYSFSMRHLPPWFSIATGIAAVTLLLCLVLYQRLRMDIVAPMALMEEATRAFTADRTYRIPPQSQRVSDDFLHLYDSFNAMAAEVQASYEKDIRILETEMDNLRLQVNPHMLLNSYNTIYALAESKNYPVIQDYALCLVDYFRYVLRRGQQLVTVRQELEFVDNFIRIQRIRFPGRFSYVYQAEDECLNAQIPPLLIENFVENAIKYALEPSQAIEIMVSVRKDLNWRGRDALHIAITDTGSGIKPQVLEKLKTHEPYIDESGKKHIGIYNCLRRIELFYGEEGEIDFASGEGKGTQIYMVVPFLTSDNEARDADEHSDRGR